MEQFKDIVPNHFVSADISDYPPEFHAFRDQLEGRSMLVHRAKMVEVECVARGYVSGSGWKDYQRDGRICGIYELPAGLNESSQLPEPIFTPASKAQSGHDENISFETIKPGQIGEPLAAQLRDLTLAIYQRAASYAETKGIIIADTKFEFGLQATIVLADEVLTPDSSPGAARQLSISRAARSPPSTSNMLRGLSGIHSRTANSHSNPAADVMGRTSEKYREAYRVLTGKSL